MENNNQQDQKSIIEARGKRIVARGEHSNHSHVMFGDVQFLENCMQVGLSPDYEKAVALKAATDAKLNELKAKHFPAGATYEAQLFAFDDLPQAEKNKILDDIKAEATPMLDAYNKEIEAMDVATIRHVLESNYLATGDSLWTKEHTHIPVAPGTKYKYVPQVEWHPYIDEIRRVAD